MNNMRKLIAAGILGVIVIAGVLGYSVLRTPEEASAPIAAVPIASSGAAASSSGEAQPSAEPSVSSASSATESVAPSASVAVAATSEAASAEGSPAVDTTAESQPIIAQIVQAESQARFVIDEVLNNAPKTVVGVTDQVAGEIAVDAQDPSKTRVGVIQVNARTLATDSEFRDRAIKNRILNTDQYEFVTFTPTEITGLPETGAVGQTYTFQIVGDLQVRDVTRQVTFDVTATPTSETRLEGKAQTTIRYADWNITIPQVRQVASVSDQLRLEIDFVATPK
jgi:polyisoprenoid-binding protein YceI